MLSRLIFFGLILVNTAAEGAQATDNQATGTPLPTETTPPPTSPKSSSDNLCQIALDDSQRSQIQTAYQAYISSLSQLADQIGSAKRAYIKVVADPGSTESSAQAAVQNLVSLTSQRDSASLTYKTQVFYEILKPEQRRPALLCQKMRHRFLWK